MKYETTHPAVLEQTLRWQDLSVPEQDALIELIKSNSAPAEIEKLREVFDVVMPSFLTIPFPLIRVNPNAAANVFMNAQLLVEPRASSEDAGLLIPENVTPSTASD